MKAKRDRGVVVAMQVPNLQARVRTPSVAPRKTQVTIADGRSGPCAWHKRVTR